MEARAGLPAGGHRRRPIPTRAEADGRSGSTPVGFEGGGEGRATRTGGRPNRGRPKRPPRPPSPARTSGGLARPRSPAPERGPPREGEVATVKDRPCPVDRSAGPRGKVG